MQYESMIIDVSRLESKTTRLVVDITPELRWQSQESAFAARRHAVAIALGLKSFFVADPVDANQCRD